MLVEIKFISGQKHCFLRVSMIQLSDFGAYLLSNTLLTKIPVWYIFAITGLPVRPPTVRRWRYFDLPQQLSKPPLALRSHYWTIKILCRNRKKNEYKIADVCQTGLWRRRRPVRYTWQSHCRTDNSFFKTIWAWDSYCKCVTDPSCHLNHWQITWPATIADLSLPKAPRRRVYNLLHAPQICYKRTKVKTVVVALSSLAIWSNFFEVHYKHNDKVFNKAQSEKILYQNYKSMTRINLRSIAFDGSLVK